MLQRASVLLGLAILLSLLFPFHVALKEGGYDPHAFPLQGIDLAGLGALFAVLPSSALYRIGRLEERVSRWSPWLALLALFSLLFLLLHVRWSHELAVEYLQEAGLAHRWVLQGAELAIQLGVLVCMVAVLVNLHAVPEEPIARRRRKKQ